MATLTDLAGAKTLRLTTTGRKSGRKRTAEVWFVVDEEGLLVQAGPQGRRGWYVNLTHDPRVEVTIGDRALRGTAEVLAVGEQERVAALFRRKYWLARVARWFGSQIGRGLPVRIRVVPDA